MKNVAARELSEVHPQDWQTLPNFCANICSEIQDLVPMWFRMRLQIQSFIGITRVDRNRLVEEQKMKFDREKRFKGVKQSCEIPCQMWPISKDKGIDWNDMKIEMFFFQTISDTFLYFCHTFVQKRSK